MLKYFSIIFFFIFILASCEKEINVKLPPYNPKVVIEGWIEPGQPAMVLVTRNAAYFSTTDSTSLVNLLVRNAVIKVTDGVQTDSLTLGLDLRYFPPLVYKGQKLKGEIGKSYTLTVSVDGTTYSAVTSILKPVKLDSIWFKLEPTTQDTFGLIWAKFTDPPGVANYYRIFTQRLNKDKIFIPVDGSVSDDKFFDGKTFSFSIRRGSSTSANQYKDNKNEKSGKFKIGDTVIIKACSIDKANYDFWRTVEQEINSGGNPFGSPIPIISNINNALGVWGGYGPFLDTLIVK